MKGSILIVDDEAAARKTLLEMLKLEGYQVSAAADGETALNMISEAAFDLAILDIKMPGIDGMQVLKEIKTQSPETQIIMLTAHGTLDTAVEALRSGAHDYLQKPAVPEEILSAIAKGISRRIETERKQRILSQMESSLKELKDYENVEPVNELSRAIYTLADEVKIDLERREIWKGDKLVSLTPTEGKLLKTLLENRGRVLSHKELVLFVQGYKTTEWEAPEIMRPLVSRLRRKLSEFHGASDWIMNVRGTGYVFED